MHFIKVVNNNNNNNNNYYYYYKRKCGHTRIICREEKSYVKFVPDIFWSFEMKFRSFLTYIFQ